MSSSVPAIEVTGLSKCYEIYDHPRDRLKQFFFPKIKSMLGMENQSYYREFWALRDISFSVPRGETVGVIGKNGSGKSTLLQLICGTLSPTQGAIHTQGRIAALLELGSGFNPEFTGRENIYLNAAVLGLSKDEIDSCFDDILAFADIGEFINQPVKTYSSGMGVRLAFAVQSQINPDILIVDEALSVGDVRFQAKCFERLRQLKENGTSILLVTHSSEQIVAHCSSAILLNQGRQIEIGEPRRVINRYTDLLFGKEKKLVNISTAPQMLTDSPMEKKDFHLSADEDLFGSHVGYNPHEYRWGDGSVSILDFYLAADGVAYPSSIESGQAIQLALAIRFSEDLVRPILGITIKTKEGISVYGANTETLDCEAMFDAGAKDSVVIAKAKFNADLAPGDYFISLGVATRQGEELTPHDRRYDSIHLVVRPNGQFFGLINLAMQLEVNITSS
jgi:lipopolysaccharide transport system ATP-binding protein